MTRSEGGAELRLGATVALDIEKAVAGGRMLARLDGRIVLVQGTIPGERVRARVERAARGVVYAETVEVLEASSDRRTGRPDWRCGGAVYHHVAYPRQLTIKGEVMADAFARVGRIPMASVPTVVGSPETGYRLRARFHLHEGRIGFYREGSHDVCDAGATGQLLPQTVGWIADAAACLQENALRDIDAIAIAEDIDGAQRVCHLELRQRPEAGRWRTLADLPGLTGLSASGPDGAVAVLSGSPIVTDRIELDASAPGVCLELRRDVRAFFQGNRFLLGPLVRHVLGLVPPGPVVDLYAGVGLFGLAAAAVGRGRVTLVEGDPISGADLVWNAAPFGAQVEVRTASVEAFLAEAPATGPATVIVDPPRTGLSPAALDQLVRRGAPRIVYVSCDVATLARDARGLVASGYRLDEVTGFDLFPGTAHVESVALFVQA